ncbi:hypothetical protein GCM10009745_44150 [Kribbella yunnanensis]|uniref:Ribbon-helix-helix protein CopG domain-containing protein n=1 Tax=Kribbella yunnanensis TaxID=190194 RepID=A0ABP4TVR7_9ACTN
MHPILPDSQHIHCTPYPTSHDLHPGSLPGMLGTVKRITVNLPDELDHRLRQDAAANDVTVSQLIREAIESYLANAPAEHIDQPR